jgi:hypothetical protein
LLSNITLIGAVGEPRQDFLAICSRHPVTTSGLHRCPLAPVGLARIYTSSVFGRIAPPLLQFNSILLQNPERFYSVLA